MLLWCDKGMEETGEELGGGGFGEKKKIKAYTLWV